MNGYQARKIKEIENKIFGHQLWETFLSVEISSITQLGEHPNFSLNTEKGFHGWRPKIKFLISFIFLAW